MSLSVHGELTPALKGAAQLFDKTALSPDPNAPLRRQSELLGRLHAEGVIPGVYVSDGAIDPELLRSMRIRHQQLTD